MHQMSAQELEDSPVPPSPTARDLRCCCRHHWLQGAEVVSEGQPKADTKGVSLKALGTRRETCPLLGCPRLGVYSGPAEQCCSRKNCPPPSTGPDGGGTRASVCPSIASTLSPRVGEQCLGAQPCCSCLSPRWLFFFLNLFVSMLSHFF